MTRRWRKQSRLKKAQQRPRGALSVALRYFGLDGDATQHGEAGTWRQRSPWSDMWWYWLIVDSVWPAAIPRNPLGVTRHSAHLNWYLHRQPHLVLSFIINVLWPLSIVKVVGECVKSWNITQDLIIYDNILWNLNLLRRYKNGKKNSNYPSKLRVSVIYILRVYYILESERPSRSSKEKGKKRKGKGESPKPVTFSFLLCLHPDKPFPRALIWPSTQTLTLPCSPQLTFRNTERTTPSRGYEEPRTREGVTCI